MTSLPFISRDRAAYSAASPSSCAQDEAARFETYLNVVEHEFPIEFLVAGELAQFETFAIPSISRLLHRTKQYEDDGIKRLDDTRGTLYSVFVHEEGHPLRENMLTHLNWVHSHYSISNEDNLYTLLRIFFNPIEWIQQKAWRKLSDTEINAMAIEMIKIGKAMGIEFPSEDLQDLYIWQKDYRAQHQVYHEDNAAVAAGTLTAIADHFPSWMRRFIRRLVPALLHDRDLIASLGLRLPSRFDKVMTQCLLSAWRLSNKVYRPWRTRKFSQSWLVNYYPSYPDNRLDYCMLGPRKLIQKRNRTGGCPFHN